MKTSSDGLPEWTPQENRRRPRIQMLQSLQLEVDFITRSILVHKGWAITLWYRLERKRGMEKHSNMRLLVQRPCEIWGRGLAYGLPNGNTMRTIPYSYPNSQPGPASNPHSTSFEHVIAYLLSLNQAPTPTASEISKTCRTAGNPVVNSSPTSQLQLVGVTRVGRSGRGIQTAYCRRKYEETTVILEGVLEFGRSPQSSAISVQQAPKDHSEPAGFGKYFCQ
jgi:hypothetical protein